jgi:hypothetical protein
MRALLLGGFGGKDLVMAGQLQMLQLRVQSRQDLYEVVGIEKGVVGEQGVAAAAPRSIRCAVSTSAPATKPSLRGAAT